MDDCGQQTVWVDYPEQDHQHRHHRQDQDLEQINLTDNSLQTAGLTIATRQQNGCIWTMSDVT